MKKTVVIISVLLAALGTGCKKDDNTPVILPKNAYKNAVFIINQGNFGKANGDISYFDRDSLKLTNGLFSTANSRPPGDVLQSMAHINGSYYIIANASNKIEIVDDSLFKQAGVITGLHQPRFMISISTSKAYVSEWGDDGMTGSIAVIDMTAKTVSKRISVGKGAEEMAMSANRVYVACSGGYDLDSTLFVIDPANDNITDSIKVNYNPTSLTLDANGKLWVLCSGKLAIDYSLEIQPSLARINTANNSVETTVSMIGSFSKASYLCINNEKNKLFFGLSYGTGIYSMSINESTINKVIDKSGYGIGIDPKNNYIYCADPGDYTADGIIYRYNQSFQLVDSFKVGMIPGGFLFN